MKRSLKNEKIGKLIYDFFQEHNLKSKEKSVNLMILWDQIMGTSVSLNTKSIYVKHDKLYIRIKNSSLKHDLSLSKSIVLNKLKKNGLNIKEIIFL